MDFTREELENADLLLVVDSEGNYRYSSHRSDREIIKMLRSIAWKVGSKVVTEEGRSWSDPVDDRGFLDLSKTPEFAIEEARRKE